MARRSRKLKQSQKRAGKEFAQLQSFWLCVLGSASFVIAGYWGLLLGKTVPDYVEAINAHGLPPLAIALGVVFAVLGLAVWWFGSIAYRCNEVLVERHFR